MLHTCHLVNLDNSRGVIELVEDLLKPIRSHRFHAPPHFDMLDVRQKFLHVLPQFRANVRAPADI